MKAAVWEWERRSGEKVNVCRRANFALWERDTKLKIHVYRSLMSLASFSTTCYLMSPSLILEPKSPIHDLTDKNDSSELLLRVRLLEQLSVIIDSSGGRFSVPCVN